MPEDSLDLLFLSHFFVLEVIPILTERRSGILEQEYISIDPWYGKYHH